MQKRFQVLSFLCWVQIVTGALVIFGSLAFFAISLITIVGSDAPLPQASELMIGGIVLGGIFLGLSIIAMAQVYQCLMQVEINTRPSGTELYAAPPQFEETRGIANNPLVDRGNLGAVRT
jgi:hypothetical protein